MRVLALDSSGIVASVAVVEDDTLVAEYTVNYKKTHSQTLLPMLDEIVKMTELDLKTIDAIAVADKLTVPFSFAPAHLSRQRAGAVGALGVLYYKEGRTETAAEHKPDYLRVSQAERERAQKLKKGSEGENA